MFKVIYFITRRGENRVREFLRSLSDERVRIKILTYIGLLEEKGHLLRRPYAAILRDGIYELRPDFGHLAPRILYFFDKSHIILTHGFLKKSDEVPDEEIKKSIEIRKDYFRN